MPQDTDDRPRRGLLGKWPLRHPVRVLVALLAVLVALVLALAAAVAALSGRHGGDPAVPAALVLACPDDWVGYRSVCYHLSRDEGSWEWSQEQCSSHGASLAMPRREGEMVSEGLLGGFEGVRGLGAEPGVGAELCQSRSESAGRAGELLQQLWSLLEQAWGGSCCHPRAGGSRVGLAGTNGGGGV
ncbi:uncharacterized protein FN964_016546 [Alca torda]